MMSGQAIGKATADIHAWRWKSCFNAPKVGKSELLQ